MRWKEMPAAIAICGALTGLIAGCGDDGAAGEAASSGGGDEPVELALFGFSAENSYTQAILKGAEAEAAELGATIRFFDGKFDPAVQSAQIQDAAASGRYDGFLITPNDPPSAAPVVREAVAQGVKVAAVQFNIGKELNEDLQVDGLTTRVIYGYEEGARVNGERVVALCADKDPCNVVVMWGQKSALFEAARRDGFNAAIAGHENIEIVAEPDAGYLRDPAYKAMQDVLQSERQIDVVVTNSGDQMIAGAEQALREAGIKAGPGRDEAKLIGNSASQTSIKGIRAGTWDGTYLELPETMGRRAVTELVNSVRGKSFSDYVNMDEVSLDCGNAAYVDAKFVDNCPEFDGEWDG